MNDHTRHGSGDADEWAKIKRVIWPGRGGDP
jgi:hypothetical protein